MQVSATDEGLRLRERVADLPHRLACAVGLDTAELTTMNHLLGRVRAAAAVHSL
jgi:hypothetical protein